MSSPFLGEIRIWAIPYAPKDWALCQGQTLQISQNQALFSLLNATFGGDGRTTFGLPNMQGCVPVAVGSAAALGANGGEASHTLTVAEIPPHNHALLAKAAQATALNAAPGPSKAVAEGIAAQSSGGPKATNNFGTGSASVAFAGDAVGNNVGGQPHENRQPFMALNFCIALQGLYPSRS